MINEHFMLPVGYYIKGDDIHRAEQESFKEYCESFLRCKFEI
jgi:hypothetical protein